LVAGRAFIIPVGMMNAPCFRGRGSFSCAEAEDDFEARVTTRARLRLRKRRGGNNVSQDNRYDPRVAVRTVNSRRTSPGRPDDSRGTSNKGITMNEFNAVSTEELTKVEGGGWLDVLDTVLTITSPIYVAVKNDPIVKTLTGK
jgi:hypothetical protein